MLLLGGESPATARATLVAALESGRALDAFRRFVEAQGGDPRVVDDPGGVLPCAPHRRVLEAQRAGIITGFDCSAVGRACGVLGGGRATAQDSVDFAVGLLVNVKIGSQVEPGTPLFDVSFRDAGRADAAEAILRKAIVIGEVSSSGVASDGGPLVYERLAAADAAR